MIDVWQEGDEKMAGFDGSLRGLFGNHFIVRLFCKGIVRERISEQRSIIWCFFSGHFWNFIYYGSLCVQEFSTALEFGFFYLFLLERLSFMPCLP